MSRSYAPSDDGYSRYSASSPMSYVDDDPPSDPSLRPMRLKILYTCDDKANCMAKWYQIVHIRTAFLDERTEIGVVELKTCIKAIITCSPELVAKLGQDYTVYAYDYSEYEVPLVGQGMLSWVLASASPTISAPAVQSSTMVTGRVTKNGKALFSRDTITETLEVKLRLVPVPTILQSEYIESMKRYRDISQMMPSDFDSQGWTEFLKANPQVLSMIGSTRNDSLEQRQAVGNNIGIEQVQKLMQRTQSFNQKQPGALSRRESFAGSVASNDQSRRGSPTPSVQMQRQMQDRHQDPIVRPDSRASSHSLKRAGSNEIYDDSGFASNDERQEDGTARKRARPTQVKRPRKSEAFGNQVDSLRVVASSAASVRVLQPTAIRPGPMTSNSLEEPPRAPTPVPQRSGLGPRRAPLQSRRSGLGQVSSFPSSDHDPGFHDSGRLGESAASPDGQSVLMSSPGEDPGSSPPVPPSRGVSAAPSSPQLPRLPPPHEDSGFMSGAMDEDYGDHRRLKPSIENTLPLPTSDAPKPPPRARKTAAKRPRADSTSAQQTPEEKAAEISRKNARRAIGWRRIQSWNEGPSSEAVVPSSDMPPPEYPQPQQSDVDRARIKQPYDRDHQKGLIQGRLSNAIQNGEMPPYCENCGDINTPTWRKAWTRIYSGSPDNVVLSKEPGGVVAVQVVEQNAEGQISLFKIIKKSLLEGDEDFGQMLLCNPCGLWLVNRKQMRPPERWNTSDKRKSQPRSGSGKPRQRNGGSGRSATAAPSEATEPASELGLAPYESRIDPRLLNNSTNIPQTEAPEQDEEPELPTLPEEPRRPTSNGKVKAKSDGNAPTAMVALQRAIQSSPGQFRGSKQSPIEVDQATPDRTRRALFPSPKSASHCALGVSSGNRQRHSLQNSPDVPKQYKGSNTHTPSGSGNRDKENNGPIISEPARPKTPSPNMVDDYFHDLFNEASGPTTPPRHGVTLPGPRSPCNIFKTPSKQTPQKQSLGTGDFFSSAAKAFLHPPRTPSRTPSKTTQETPNAETPFTRHINQLLSEPAEGFNMNTSPSALFAEFGHSLNDFVMSTDMPMPSSPPVGISLNTSRPVEDWSELGLNSSPFKASPRKAAVAQDWNDEITNKEQDTAAA